MNVIKLATKEYHRLFLPFLAFLVFGHTVRLLHCSNVNYSDYSRTAADLLVAPQQDAVEERNILGWPSTAVEELGYPLVRIGKNFVEKSRELIIDLYLEEFLEVYSNRPDKVNLCGIRINHAYALWLTVKEIQPQTVIESGVNAGQSTYFIRNASSSTRIYAIDPLVQPICNQAERWIDKEGEEAGLTTYLVGPSSFKDIQEFDWKSAIMDKTIDPGRTLVFLDDHLEVLPRFSTILKFGFRHVMLEDNYKLGEGATPGDKAGFTLKQLFSKPKGNLDSEFIFHQLVSYAEFPPLVPPVLATNFRVERKRAGGFMVASDTNHDIVAPLLRPDVSAEDNMTYYRICEKLQLDPSIKDRDSYMQLMNYNQICYMEVRALSPRLAEMLT
mmetsp:Transcript_15975/g.34733  ORF Transcript_15975/g.34733 Transcript_15975/m.34733 type:complete len:386 (+) Transcript_15975:41-1198(+)